MDIRGMHYDYKQKLNKIDSQQYRNLRVPEIDWKLNEALEIFIKNVAEPRTYSQFGFEKSQRNLDDIRTLVVNDRTVSASASGVSNFTVSIPEDYMFLISCTALINREGCASKYVRATLRQHDDEFEQSPFDRSSFEWGEVNFTIDDNGLLFYTDGTFTVQSVQLNFIKKHEYIHNAQDFLPTSSYNLPDGSVLTGTVDCELPEHTHREIVDIAVLITTGDLQIPDYQIKQAKINLNQN